jgi:hypothetical protein
MPFRSAQADRRPKAPQGRIHSAHPAPGVGLRQRKERSSGRRRPTVGRRPPEVEFIRRAGRPLAESPPGRIHSAHPAPGISLRQRKECLPGQRRLSRRLEIGLLRRLRARRRPPPTQRMPFRSAQADHWPKAPGGRIHSAHPAPGVGLRRRKERFSGRRRPTVGRRPPKVEFIRRAGRPLAESPPGRIHSAHPAPGVGLRQRKERSSGRRRPTVGRRPPKVEFIRRAGRPLAEGPPRPNSFGTPRARHQPPPTQRMPSRSAQADRRPKAPQGRIHSAHPAPGVGLRRRKEAFSGRRRPSHRLKSALRGACAPGVGLRRRKRRTFGRRRPTVGRRPFKVAFIRRAGRPSAEGPPRSNSFDAQGRPSAEGLPRPNSSGAFRRPPNQAPHGAAL